MDANDSIERFVVSLGNALYENSLDSKIIGGRYKLVIGIDAAILIDLISSPPTVVQTTPEVGRATVDASVKFASAAVFYDMLERRLTPHAAFIRGDVAVDGDMSALPKVARALQLLQRSRMNAQSSRARQHDAVRPPDHDHSRGDGMQSVLTRDLADAGSGRSLTAVSITADDSRANLEASSSAAVGRTGQPSRNDSPHCEVCGSSFGILRRRHACRECARAVCDSCCSTRTPSRVCKRCVTDRALAAAGPPARIAVDASSSNGYAGAGQQPHASNVAGGPGAAQNSFADAMFDAVYNDAARGGPNVEGHSRSRAVSGDDDVNPAAGADYHSQDGDSSSSLMKPVTAESVQEYMVSIIDAADDDNVDEGVRHRVEHVRDASPTAFAGEDAKASGPVPAVSLAPSTHVPPSTAPRAHRSHSADVPLAAITQQAPEHAASLVATLPLEMQQRIAAAAISVVDVQAVAARAQAAGVDVHALRALIDSSQIHAPTAATDSSASVPNGIADVNSAAATAGQIVAASPTGAQTSPSMMNPPSSSSAGAGGDAQKSPSVDDQLQQETDRLNQLVYSLEEKLSKTTAELLSFREESASNGAASIDRPVVAALLLVAILCFYFVFFVGRSWISVTRLLALFIGSSIVYLLAQPSHPISRRLRAFYAVGVVLIGLRQLRQQTKDLSDDQSQPAWDAAHRVYARFLVNHMLSLRGLWVKVGQYLSSRADVVPTEYVRELSKLQDSNPADPFQTVLAIIEAELGCAWGEVFASIDQTPLGSASIAQVHRAQLLAPATISMPRVKPSSGVHDSDAAAVAVPEVEWHQLHVRDVVVKVQHPGIESVMRSDFWTLQTIIRLVAWLEKDYDFRPVIDEWAKESIKELSFVREGVVTRHMAQVTAATGLAVGIPAVVGLDAIRLKDGQSVADVLSRLQLKPAESPAASTDAVSVSREFPVDCDPSTLATPRLLILQFIDAFKVTDTDKLDSAKIDRTRLLTDICRAYAVYMHVEGCFSGDPHPANVLADAKGRAWLIDYGLTKVLPPPMRLAFASMVVSAQNADAAGLLDSFDAMGLLLSREAPGEDLDNIRFMLRDTMPVSDARKYITEKRAVWRERMAKRKAAKLRKPIDSWPSDLLLYMRAGEILRGLGSSLDVRVPYMRLMAEASLAAVRAHTAPSLQTLASAAGHPCGAASRSFSVLKSTPDDERSMHAAHLSWLATVAASMRAAPSLPLAITPPASRAAMISTVSSSLTMRAQSLLQRLFTQGSVTGCQVAVQRGGELILDTSFGELGPLDPRPVSSDTLFNAFSVTKGVTTTLIHMMIEEVQRVSGGVSLVTYDTRLTEIWPSFASSAVSALPDAADPHVRALAASKAETTLRHVFSHSTGLQHAIPTDISMTKISNIHAMMDAMEIAVPVWVPGTATSYHYYTFGWLAAGILRGLQNILVERDKGWLDWSLGNTSGSSLSMFGSSSAAVSAAVFAAPLLHKPKFSVGQLLQKLIVDRIGVHGEMYIGLPGSEREAEDVSATCIPSHRLAVLSGSANSRMGMMSGADLSAAAGSGPGAPPSAAGAAAAAAQNASGAPAGAGLGSMLEKMLQKSEDEAAGMHPSAAAALGLRPHHYNSNDTGADSPSPEARVNGHDTAASAPSADHLVAATRKADTKALMKLLSSLREKAYLFDPRLFNRMQLRRGEIPAANGHFTARALAKMYACLGASMPKHLATGSAPSAADNALPRLLATETLSMACSMQQLEKQQSNAFVQGGSTTKWGLGYQLYGDLDSKNIHGGDCPSAPAAAQASASQPAEHANVMTSPKAAKQPAVANSAGRSASVGPSRLRSQSPSMARKVAPHSTVPGAQDAAMSKRRNYNAALGGDEDAAAVAGDLEAVLTSSLHPGAGGSDRYSHNMKMAEPGAAAAPTTIATAFGHSGLGGSLAFYDTTTGCGVAILVNKLSQSKEATKAVLQLLADEGIIGGVEAF